jgi:hypothetical protein
MLWKGNLFSNALKSMFDPKHSLFPSFTSKMDNKVHQFLFMATCNFFWHKTMNLPCFPLTSSWTFHKQFNSTNQTMYVVNVNGPTLGHGLVLDSLHSHNQNLGGGHHPLPYNILWMFLWGLHWNDFFLGIFENFESKKFVGSLFTHMSFD